MQFSSQTNARLIEALTEQFYHFQSELTERPVCSKKTHCN
jgi:hypothetical protein